MVLMNVGLSRDIYKLKLSIDDADPEQSSLAIKVNNARKSQIPGEKPSGFTKQKILC